MVCAFHAVATAVAPAATATTEPTRAVRSAAWATARRSARLAVRRRTWSATVVTTAAVTAVATSARAHFPLPGVTGRRSRSVTSGTTRLPTPIVRLVTVSRRSYRPAS